MKSTKIYLSKILVCSDVILYNKSSMLDSSFNEISIIALLYTNMHFSILQHIAV